MKKIVLCPNPHRDIKLQSAMRAAEILKECGFELSVCFPFETDEDASPLHLPLLPIQQAVRQADCMVCLGGDGTILRVARLCAQRALPLLTVNLGNLGFICELSALELEKLRQLQSGQYTLDRRMMLDVSVRRDGKRVYSNLALNEAVVNKGAVSRVVALRASVNGHKLFDCRGDGLIVATATGSTGYSLSAGGPILEPTTKNLIVTPICAHNARFSSYVLAPGDSVTVEPVGNGRNNGYLCVDGGRIFTLRSGDVLELRQSACEMRFVRFSNRSFYEECEQKMITGGFRYEK